MKKRATIDESMARRYAVAADCDPRTIKKLIRGEPVREIPGVRARAVLVAAGLLVDGTERAER